MATLTIQPISRTITALAAVAAAVGGDLMPNNGQEFLAVVNGSGASVTVTAAITKQTDGITPAGKAIVVPAGATALFGPFPPTQYNDANGKVAFTYSAVTTVTVQALQLIGVVGA
jgi:hypothetical protein